MPIVVTNEGWVKVPPKRNIRPSKPVDPVDAFRGPLAYITGRPEFKEPVKKQSIKQLMIEAARTPAPPPLIPMLIDEAPKPVRSSRTRSRVASEPVTVKSSRHRGPVDVFEEADEEILRPDLQDTQSRRSASPAASRHSRAAPSTRSRRHVSVSQPVYDDDQDNHRHNRSRRHASSSVYSVAEDRHDDHRDRDRDRLRSNRSERSYREPSYRERSRERERDRYYPQPMPYASHYPHHYAPHPPAVQPIVIYSSPAPGAGCGGHHSCHGGYSQSSCHTSHSRPLGITGPTTPVQAALLEPKPKTAPSEISSVSSGSTRSKAMSYKWYTATQPLAM